MVSLISPSPSPPSKHLQEEPINAPAEGHIRVAVKAIGLNLADVFAIIGLYSATPKGQLVYRAGLCVDRLSIE